MILKSPFEFCEIRRDVRRDPFQNIFHFRFWQKDFGFLTASRIRYLASLSETKVIFRKCDSSVMPGNTVFHFATAASLGLRTFNEFKQLMAYSFF